MIVSAVAGRIRVRSNLLKSREFAQNVQRRAEGLSGVNEVRVNPSAGSIVVSYDASRADIETLESELEALCFRPQSALRPRNADLSRQLNRATKIGMVTSLGTAVAMGFMGKKKAHIGFGTAFLALAGLHIWRNRRTLLR
jgi:copper chaperone CopZ